MTAHSPHVPGRVLRALGGSRWLLLAFGLMTAVACDEQLKDLTGPTPQLHVSFGSIQTEIFQTTDSAGRTACTNCHTNNGRAPAGGLNLLADFAYSALVNVPSRQKSGAILVIPGDPDNSYLIQKLEGSPGIVGLRMPRNGPPHLTSGQILVVRRWIQNGAPAN